MQFCDYIADQIEQNRYQVFIDQSQHSWYAVPQADKLLGHREAIELLCVIDNWKPYDDVDPMGNKVRMIPVYALNEFFLKAYIWGRRIKSN